MQDRSREMQMYKHVLDILMKWHPTNWNFIIM